MPFAIILHFFVRLWIIWSPVMGHWYKYKGNSVKNFFWRWLHEQSRTFLNDEMCHYYTSFITVRIVKGSLLWVACVDDIRYTEHIYNILSGKTFQNRLERQGRRWVKCTYMCLLGIWIMVKGGAWLLGRILSSFETLYYWTILLCSQWMLVLER